MQGGPPCDRVPVPAGGELGPALTVPRPGLTVEEMRARWATFAVGLWLMLAPLVLGYPTVTAVLHDVALGLLLCVGTLAALEWPLLRFTLAAPAVWLLAAGDALGWGSRAVTANELASGLVVLLLALVPSGRVGVARQPARSAAQLS
jgi:hypothetical protein